MITWTNSAKEALESYCRRARENLRGSGADADEVADDLRRHIEEEVRAAKLTVATEEEVRRILAKVGDAFAPNEKCDADHPPKKASTAFLAVAFLFGVLLPLGTLVFEMITAASAGVLFDPIPSWFQVAMVALVPGVNLWLIRMAASGRCRFPKVAGWLAGAAAGVSCFYSILYLPFVPFAGIAILFFGLGFIPLAPYFALLFTALLKRSVRSAANAPLTGFARGLCVGLGVLVLLQLPAGLTYYGMSAATSDDPGTERRGIRTLRWFGDRDLLLRQCYAGMRGGGDMDLVRMIATGNRWTTTDQAREIYYRVTGRPFNSVPPPTLYTRMGRWSELDDEFTWDDAVGGEAVAGRVKGLSLLSSRMDAVAEPDAAAVYCQWTMEFKNVSRLQREARAQIALPPGGIVSRLTLWVNGEEREAAFGGRSQVREAYQKIAVVQRRDPVLVTTCGPDRVLIQCFPVPANGGTMKVRVGITAPLVLESLDRGRCQWPHFIERNFGIGPDFKHSLWMDSPQKIVAAGAGLTTDHTEHKWASHGVVTEADLSNVIIERSATVRSVWTPAPDSGWDIRQRIEEAPARPVSRIVFVIDGSAGMSDAASEIAEAIRDVSDQAEVVAIFAGDEPQNLNPAPELASKKLIERLNNQIRRANYAGGRDNIPALEQAWDIASSADSSAIVWIHDSQPVLLSSTDSLRQRFERSLKNIPVYDLQTRRGPNRIAEKLDGVPDLKSAWRSSGSLSQDIRSLLETLDGKGSSFEFVRERVSANEITGKDNKVGPEIERLWAADEAGRLADKHRRDDAIRLAAAQHLVTPVTGAVVLENEKQYAENNLKPADPSIVPTIPEPHTVTLLLFGGAFAWRRKRAKRRQS